MIILKLKTTISDEAFVIIRFEMIRLNPCDSQLHVITSL